MDDGLPLQLLGSTCCLHCATEAWDSEVAADIEQCPTEVGGRDAVPDHDAAPVEVGALMAPCIRRAMVASSRDADLRTAVVPEAIQVEQRRRGEV
jgi:hypothetical protein